MYICIYNLYCCVVVFYIVLLLSSILFCCCLLYCCVVVFYIVLLLSSILFCCFLLYCFVVVFYIVLLLSSILFCCFHTLCARCPIDSIGSFSFLICKGSIKWVTLSFHYRTQHTHCYISKYTVRVQINLLLTHSQTILLVFSHHVLILVRLK